jgi:hypothetical protein
MLHRQSAGYAWFAVFVPLVFVATAQARASQSGGAVGAAPSASPMPSASAAPTATPRPLGLRFSTDISTTLIDQNTSGPGQLAPEDAGFINGSAFAPNTPYDLFSSAPQVPGVAGLANFQTTATYGFHAFDAGVTAALGYVRGSVTNAAYWGESLMPTINPHLGSQALPYQIAFPTAPGQDDGTAVRASILAGSLASADGNLRLRGGWFDLAQTDRFVFAPPALTNASPAIGFAPAETLGNGLPGLDDWQPAAPDLPLHGLDVVAKRGIATFEATDADLAALPGSPARVTMGSVVFDRGEGTRFSAQLAHITTGGLPVSTTVPFGSNPQFTLFPEGVLPTSLLGGQRQTVAGLRGAFHVLPNEGVDGTIEIGRAWYDANGVAQPGTSKPGGYYHAGFSKTQGRITASIDYYRFEPRYAPAILPYGIAENQWSAALAWPGQWLKSNFQSVDNSVLGINRQGYRVRYFVDKGPLEAHLEYLSVTQIEPETTLTSEQTGFVDGYYLPQLPNAATFGAQKRFGFWAAWHPSFGDLTLDVVDDTEYRGFAASHPEDAVSYEVPQAVLTFARHFSATVVGSLGIGRFAMKGAFAEPIDFAQRTFLAGVEIKQSPATSLLMSFRRSAFEGIPTTPAARVSPNYTGSTLIVEQRVHI